MPTPRTYGSVDRNRQRNPQRKFTLQGLYEFDVRDAAGKVVHQEGEEWQETFTCLRNPPPAVLDDLMRTTTASAKGVTAWDKASLVAFVTGVVVPEDEARLEALLRDKARPMDLQEDFGPLVMDLAEALGHPTAPPSS